MKILQEAYHYEKLRKDADMNVCLTFVFVFGYFFSNDYRMEYLICFVHGQTSSKSLLVSTFYENKNIKNNNEICELLCTLFQYSISNFRNAFQRKL